MDGVDESDEVDGGVWPPSGFSVDDELLTATEVGRLMRLDPKTVVRYAHTGLLASVVTPGRHHRFRRSVIRQWLDTGIPPTPGPEVG